MKTRLLLLAAVAVTASLAVTAAPALASGGGGGGGDKCARLSNYGVTVGQNNGWNLPEVDASFTVTNCSSTKTLLIDTDFILKDTLGNTIWMAGSGCTYWLAPGQSVSCSFANLAASGGIGYGSTYDLQFSARDFTKLDVLTTADVLFTTPPAA